MDYFNVDPLEPHRQRPLPPMSFVLVTALEQTIGPYDRSRSLVDRALRRTPPGGAEVEVGWAQAAQSGLIDTAGGLTDDGRIAAYRILSAL
jgi:hypothetical protein